MKSDVQPGHDKEPQDKENFSDAARFRDRHRNEHENTDEQEQDPDIVSRKWEEERR